MDDLMVRGKGGLVRYRPKPVVEFFKESEEKAMSNLRLLAAAEKMCTYELGCYLYRVVHEGLWRKPKYCTRKQEYSTYGNWVFGELGFTARKGRHLVRIATRIAELKIPIDMVEKLLAMGWSRATHLMRAETVEELTAWYNESHDFTEAELATYVRVKVASRNEPEGENGKLTRPVLQRIKFTEKSNYGFYRQVQTIMEKKFGLTVQEDIMGCLCAHYLATSLPGNGEEVPMQLDQILQGLEKQYGVKLAVVIDQKEDCTFTIR